MQRLQQARSIAVDLFRGWPLLLLGLIGLAGVCYLAPDQVTNILNQQCKMFIAGYSAYWLDRFCFPWDRVRGPELDQTKEAHNQIAAQYRRAIIIAAALVMSGLNP